MISLHYTPKDEFTGELLNETKCVTFDNKDEAFAFLCAELNADDDFVYLAAFNGHYESPIFVDHITGHILAMFRLCVSDEMHEGKDVDMFLLIHESYEEAYELAAQMKEPTGLAYAWQHDNFEDEPILERLLALKMSNAN